MLVTFSCSAHADITMFGDVALHLLKLMGHRGTVPSAILAEDIVGALDRLKAGLEAEQSAAGTSMDAPNEDLDQTAVSMRQRALPLIELLTAAAKENCHVMWK